MHPTLLHIGHLRLPTFGLLAALGLMLALWLATRCAPMAGVSADGVWDATLFAVVAAFALSRLLLVLTNFRSFLEYPVLLLAVPSLTGLGLLLTGVATAVYLRLHRLPVLRVLDAWAAPAAVLWAFLALGHMAEGSDAGLPSRAPWAVRVGADPDLQQPVALFAAAVAVAVALVLFWWLRRTRVEGTTAALGSVLVGVAQFLLTFLRQPYPYAPDAPNFVLDPIEFLALGMVAAGGVMYAMATMRGKTRVGAAVESEREIAAGEVR